MVNLVEAVGKGINEKHVFNDPSLNSPIFYRAITRYEHEEARNQALMECENPRIAKILVDRLMQKFDPGSTVNLETEDYVELRKHYLNVMLHVVYMGTKDFQPPGYSTETIKDSYIDVLSLAENILDKSIAKEEEITQFIKNGEGKNLAVIHYVLKVPLASEAWKLTPLQLEFLIQGKKYLQMPKGKAPTLTNEDLNKDPVKYKEYLKALFGHGGGNLRRSLDQGNERDW